MGNCSLNQGWFESGGPMLLLYNFGKSPGPFSKPQHADRKKRTPAGILNSGGCHKTS